MKKTANTDKAERFQAGSKQGCADQREVVAMETLVSGAAVSYSRRSGLFKLTCEIIGRSCSFPLFYFICRLSVWFNLIKTVSFNQIKIDFVGFTAANLESERSISEKKQSCVQVSES